MNPYTVHVLPMTIKRERERERERKREREREKEKEKERESIKKATETACHM